MKQPSTPSFAQLERILHKARVNLHPSQLHALLCGIICGSSTKEQVTQALLEQTTVCDFTKAQEGIRSLIASSEQQLNEFLFEFYMLLPTDEHTLPKRAEALTLWCQGFLTGLELKGIKISAREPSETTEAIQDLIEIANMKYEDVVPSEEDESAYTELVEYVRMAVILIYQDLRTELRQAERGAMVD